MGDNLPYVDIGKERTAKSIATGSVHTCAILDNDQIKCWGAFTTKKKKENNIKGDGVDEMGENLPEIQLGQNYSAIQISLGQYFSCAILNNQKLKCWGDNVRGSLGLGTKENMLYRFDLMGENLPFIDFGENRTVKEISVYGRHACVILDNGSVKCWGDNSDGALGLGDKNNRGDNSREMGRYLPAVDLGMGRSAKKISVGRNHVCTILDNDKVKCWGYNSPEAATLGLGDSKSRGGKPNQMGDDLPFVDIF